jgi:hypothetical protein
MLQEHHPLSNRGTFLKRSPMTKVLHVVHSETNTTDFLSTRLFSAQYQRSLLQRCGSSLQKLREHHGHALSLRYTIDVAWTEPISLLLRASHFCVHERRTLEPADSPLARTVTSTIRADCPGPADKALTAKVTRRLVNQGCDVMEDLVIEVAWRGSIFKAQIEADFYNALFPMLLFGDEQQIDPESAPQIRFPDYHRIHAQLETLCALGERLRVEVEDAHCARAPLGIPSGEQISHVPDLVDARGFSAADEIAVMARSVARCRDAMEGIRSEITRNNDIGAAPMLFLAACATVLFAVLRATRDG